MATLSHCKLFLQLCLVIACVCFCLLWFIFHLKPERWLSFWMSSVSCILCWFAPWWSTASQEEENSVLWSPFPPGSACLPSCCRAGLASRQHPLCVRADLSCILTCHASICGALSTLGGFECWMQLMSYLHTWLCNKSLLYVLRVSMKEVSSLTLV